MLAALMIKKRKTQRVYPNFSRKFARTCAFVPGDASQKPNGDCSEKLVHLNFLFWVDFPGGVSSCEEKLLPPRGQPLNWEVLNGVGVDGVGGNFPFFFFASSFLFVFSYLVSG